MELHHNLKRRIEVRGRLVLQTGLHIGSSDNQDSKYARLLRSVYGWPFIPGSSMKGAFRTRVEGMAHLLSSDPMDSVCFLRREKDMGTHFCLSTKNKGSNQVDDAIARWGDLPNSDAESRLSAFLKKNLCPACRLFGGASWRSRLAFDDLHPIDRFDLPVERRDCVGIDRDSRLAVDGVKFGLETVPALTAFDFNLCAENLDEMEMGLFALGLLEMVGGRISLGGKTSRGLGACRLEDLELFDHDFTDPKKVLAYFSRQEGSNQVEHPQQWLEDKLEAVLSAQEA